ncbi:MAG: hypothetical protein DMG27_16615 [Acidobacteria bacterium]|nr:MAG: hypothetical protein DMG27_16615 [Acidobacteriota bacterium]
MPAASAPQELERFQKRPQAPRPSLHNIAFSIDDSESGLGLVSRESQAVIDWQGDGLRPVRPDIGITAISF